MQYQAPKNMIGNEEIFGKMNTQVIRFGISALTIILISIEHVIDPIETTYVTPEIRAFFVKALLLISITEWGWMKINNWLTSSFYTACSQVVFVIILSGAFAYAGSVGGPVGVILVLFSGVVGSWMYADLVARGGNPARDREIDPLSFKLPHYILSAVLFLISVAVAINISG